MGGPRWMALIACAGCGRFGFSSRGADAAGSGDGPVMTADAPADAAPCASPGPWTTPQLVGINTSFNDWSPALSGDTLRLVFQSNRTGNNALFEATRSATTTQFTNALRIAELDTTGSERAPTLSADALTVYYTSDITGADLVYRADRPSLGAQFAAPQIVTVTGAGTQLGPALGPTDELFYSDTGEATIYVATGAGTSFTQVRALTELGNAAYPTLSRDGLAIYFTANSATSPAIFVATRPAIGATFGTPVAVPNIATGNFEEDPELGKDDRTLVFGAGTASNMADIFIATRTCN